ncbi:hypothetical protein BH11ARM1_BH11ARM1_01470 [soil metagenome]
MALPSTPSKENQPKIVQQRVVRTLLIVILLGGILFGIRSYRESKVDPEASDRADTAGWISAIEFKDEGQEIVAIKPDLSIVSPDGWHKGATDRDSAWDPSGNFVFYISDQAKNTFHVWRWNPTKTEALPRTVGSRGRSNPTFPTKPVANDQSMLITSGGLVMDFDPVNQKQTQILPPVGREITVEGGQDGGGQQSQFSSMYSTLGTSFRIAAYCGGDKYIAAIMRRDEGDILILQNMAPTGDQFEPPIPIAAGEHIDMSVNPTNGHVVFAVNGFQFPSQPPAQFVKNGKITKPFQHYVADLDPATKKQMILVATPNNDAAFGYPAVNPKGDSVLLVVGPYKDGSLGHKALILSPIKDGAGSEIKPLVQGAIFEPAWDSKGDKLVYAKHDAEGKRTIFTSNADGTSERSVSGGKGNFGFPHFSPQTGG